jgi:hypothetical protein
MSGTSTGVLVDYVGEKRTTDDMEYLAMAHGCVCEWKAPTLGDQYDGLVFTSDPARNAVVGRKNLTTGAVAVSKVSYPQFMQWYVDQNNNEVTFVPATEVLVCSQTSAFVQPPVFDYAPGSCAVWTPYIGDSSPVIDGIAAGLSRTNNTAYIGRGWGGGQSQYLSGTLQLNGTNAMKVISVSTELALTWPQYLVQPSNCTCEWVAVTRAIRQPGAVVVPDPNFHFYVGRKTFANGQIAISKVERDTLKQWYTNQNGVEVGDKPTEIIVCRNSEPLPPACGEFILGFLRVF